MVWNDENIKQLIKLWEKGLSTTEIAKKMNVSKNSVVGKVHRLCLKARPSPIKKKSGENIETEIIETSAVVEVKAETPAKQKSVKTKEKKQPTETKKKISKKSAVAVNEEKVQVIENEAKIIANTPKTAKKQAEHIKLVELDSHTCRWPIGDPRDEDFCFCGKKVRAGQTYCDEHSMVAYVKANSKR